MQIITIRFYISFCAQQSVKYLKTLRLIATIRTIPVVTEQDANFGTFDYDNLLVGLISTPMSYMGVDVGRASPYLASASDRLRNRSDLLS